MTKSVVDLLIRGGRVHLPGGASEVLDIAVDGDEIVGLLQPGSEPMTARLIVDARGREVLPGVVDPHFQSGNLNGIEDFFTESRSAAVGGVTTILRMHRSLEPYAADLEQAITEYQSRAWVDFAFHLAIMTRLISRSCRSTWNASA